MALSLCPARVSGPSEISPCIWGFHSFIWSFVCREWFSHSEKQLWTEIHVAFAGKSSQANPAQEGRVGQSPAVSDLCSRDKSSTSVGPGHVWVPVPGPRMAWASEHAQGWALQPLPGHSIITPKSPPWLLGPPSGSGILSSEPTQGSCTPSQRCSPVVSVLEKDPRVAESPAKPGQGWEVGQEIPGQGCPTALGV